MLVILSSRKSSTIIKGRTLIKVRSKKPANDYDSLSSFWFCLFSCEGI